MISRKLLIKIKQCLNSFRDTTVNFTLDELEYAERAVKLYQKIEDEVEHVDPLAIPEDDNSIALAVENSKLREKIRELERDKEKLGYYEQALAIIGRVGCENLHHKTNDYHMLGQDCPVEARLARLMKK